MTSDPLNDVGTSPAGPTVATQQRGGRPDDDGADELGRADDAVIGRVFRWSAVTVVAMAVVAGGIYYLSRRPPPAPPTRVTKAEVMVAAQLQDAQVPAAPFTDITAAAGITFVHNNGAYGEKLLPEAMGGGCAFFDFDGDDDADLLLVNGTYWPGHVPSGKQPTTAALYRNDGRGRFADVTAGSGLDVPLYGMGVAAGDYDGDGRADLFLTAVGGNRLFRNEGNGRFRDATAEVGVGGPGDGWSTACAFVDYDNDGRLDLFVCNYVRWTPEINRAVDYKLVGIGRAYGQPTNFEGTFPALYHNDGNGRFSDVSARAGVQVRNPATGVPACKALGVAPVDLDADGRIDFVIANDTVPNCVLHGQPDGTFREIGGESGLAFDSYGNTRGAMGIDSARYRNDGSLGIGIGNFANEMIALYTSHARPGGGGGPIAFTDDAIPEGVGPPSRLLLKFGLFFFDYDLDGWEDLLTANGHLEEEINKVQSSQHYAQPAQLFWNRGGSGQIGFAVAPSEKAGADLFKPIVGRGSAFADIDGDGDLDVILTQTGGPPLLLRNDQQLGHHWLRLKLVGNGTTTNRDAIGAQVRVRLGGGRALWRQVMPTRSYLSQSESAITIGLGEAAGAHAVEVTWPDGTKQDIATTKADAPTTIRQSN